jgi:hypothetical protein
MVMFCTMPISAISAAGTISTLQASRNPGMKKSTPGNPSTDRADDRHPPAAVEVEERSPRRVAGGDHQHRRQANGQGCALPAPMPIRSNSPGRARCGPRISVSNAAVPDEQGRPGGWRGAGTADRASHLPGIGQHLQRQPEKMFDLADDNQDTAEPEMNPLITGRLNNCAKESRGAAPRRRTGSLPRAGTRAAASIDDTRGEPGAASGAQDGVGHDRRHRHRSDRLHPAAAEQAHRQSPGRC